MQAGDDDVQFCQQVVVEIKAILEDVHFLPVSRRKSLPASAYWSLIRLYLGNLLAQRARHRGRWPDRKIWNGR